MERIKNKFTYTFAAFVAVVIFIFSSFVGGGVGSAYAAASVNDYTGVLDDLYKDESFKKSNYPVVDNDYSLQLIQIAESTNNELFVYVYQPSGQGKKLSACSINISHTINDDISFINYKIQLLNSEGVFFKYLVKDLTVTNAPTRYYVISSIYRPFDEDIDKQADFDNKITEVNYNVSKQYCFSTINGNPYCQVVDIETITITDKFIGLVRYADGFKFYPGKGACDSHFVAFNTDKPIDKLLEADVYYTAQDYSNSKFGEKSDKYAYLKYTDKVEHSGGGLYAGTYKWDRIETTEQFIAENDLTQNVYSGAVFDVNVANKITEEGKTALRSKRWVLRFVETPYLKTIVPNTYNKIYYEDLTIIGDVTILRLKFETDDVTYNLGTVDNKQSGSGKPVNDEKIDTSLNDLIKLILMLIATIFLIVLCAPVLGWVLRGLLWLITLLFKMIGKLFKRKKE